MPRPSLKISDEQRRMAKTLAAYGIKHDDIAFTLNIAPKSLRKHCPEELRRGAIEASVKVGQTLFGMATSGGNLGATIYWDRTRGARHRETDNRSVPPPQIVIRTTDGPETQSGEGGPDR
jgi:hypothetical protein